MRKMAIVPAEPAAANASQREAEVTQHQRTWTANQIIALLLIVGALWWAQAVAIPVVVALFVSYALEPVILRLESWRISRMVAVPLVLVALLALTGSGFYALRGEVVAFANRLPEGAHAIALAVRTKTSGPSGPLGKLQQAAKELEAAALASRQPKIADGVQPVRIEEPTFKWNEWIWQGSHGAVTLATQLFAVICLAYYLMLAGDSYKRKLVHLVGPSLAEKKLTVQILEEIDSQIERYLLARATISALVGLCVWITFRLLGLEEAGVWAVLSAILFTIPIAGPAIVIVGAGAAGVLQTGSIATAAAAAGICTVIAAVEGNLLAPWLMSRVGKMSAVAVFVSLLFWGWLWGAWGLILAVPITAAIKATCERVDDLGPVAEFLSD
jgi:predicted PurR-regulated permease PerM